MEPVEELSAEGGVSDWPSVGVCVLVLTALDGVGFGETLGEGIRVGVGVGLGVFVGFAAARVGSVSNMTVVSSGSRAQLLPLVEDV